MKTTAQTDSTAHNSLGATARWLAKEARAARPVFLFFFCGFMLVLLIVKLALAQYAIEVSALSRALIGALVAAKVTLILDETGLARGFARYPRIVPIAVKSIVYGLAVLVLGLAERLFDAYRHSPALGAAVARVAREATLLRLLSVVLGTTLVFAAYFVSREISDRMGPGELQALLFKAPAAGPRREAAS